jgi:trk system potassium uptake protein TrkA
MRKQIVVIGLGRLGASIARTLSSIGHEVLALDQDERLVQGIKPDVTQTVQADPTSEPALRDLGVGNFDIGIVAEPDLERNVLATILLKKLGVRYIIARATSELHGSILEKIGADKVVYPENEMGTGIAYVLTLGDVIDYIPVTAEYGVVKMSVPPQLAGKTLSETGLGHHGRWDVVVLLLQRKRDVFISPSGGEIIRPEDVLVISGNRDKLEEYLAQLRKAETVKAPKGEIA